VVGAFLAVAAPLQAETLAITGATVIDGTGAAPVTNGVVLIEDGRFAAVGPWRDVTIPAGARSIDASGKYIIPGLMDANVHLFINIDLETLITYEDRYDEIILEAAQIALKSGLTTVFDTWGPRADLVKARQKIDSGAAVGSRIYLAGNIIGFDGPLSADFYPPPAMLLTKAFVKRINDTWEQGTGRELLWMGPGEVREIVREYAGRSVDFLKYGGSGHVEMRFICFSPRVQKAIVEEGHRAGLTVQVHTTSVESLDMAIDAGVDILTHCDISGPSTPIPEATIQKLVDHGIPCSVLPITQRRLDAMLGGDPHVPSAVMTPYMETGRINERNLIDAGATLLLSTDSGIEHPVQASETEGIKVDPSEKLGEGHFNALVGLQELGMEPMEILETATSHIARAYHVEADIGTLEVGKIADLVILEKNPLEDARNYRSISAVIKDGSVVDRDALPVAPRISSIPVPD